MISKCLAWYVGVLSPAGRSAPGISLRPLSPIRHTYTSALGFSDRATSEDEEELVRGLVAPGCRLTVCLGLPVPAAVLVVWLDEEPPPLTSAITSATMIRPITPTATMYPRDGPLGFVRLRWRWGVETIGSSIASLGRSWCRRYSSTMDLPSRPSASAYVRRKLLTKVGPGSRPHSSFSSARRYFARIFVVASISETSMRARIRASRSVAPISGI